MRRLTYENEHSLNLWIPVKLHTKVKKEASARDMTIREFIIVLLSAYFGDKSDEKKKDKSS